MGTVRDKEEGSYSEMVKREESLRDRWKGRNSGWERGCSVRWGSRQGRKERGWQEL